MYKDHPAMAVGDDYTFGKDIIEIGLVMLILINLPIMYFSPVFQYLTLGFVGLLVMIESYYSFTMNKKFFEFIIWNFVMFFRSFARTFGFLSGIWIFLIKKSKNK